MRARIVSAHGRHYGARDESDKIWQCFARGKKREVCVGDWVELSQQSEEQARIEGIEPRRNLLFRSDQMRSKLFAANVDLVLIIVSGSPPFSEDLLGRALTGAAQAQITPVIVLNKCDLIEESRHAKETLQYYQALGYHVIEVSTREVSSIEQRLKPMLQGKTALLLGQSAMGKSSILNVLVPDAGALTQMHSQALNSGRHTTTLTQLYRMPDQQTELIDSPGFQGFGLAHLQPEDIVRGFPEFEPYLGQCRFYNCRHLSEPGCAVTQACREGLIRQSRYDLYVRLLAELDQKNAY